MPSVFTRIIDGELPARFVWKDDRCVAFLSINPLQPGHVLVVPREEIDHWIDLPVDAIDHLMRVSHILGRALQQAFRPAKVGLMLAGLEVPHTHVHLVPIRRVHDLDFSNADMSPQDSALDDAANTIRGALRAMGVAQVSD